MCKRILTGGALLAALSVSTGCCRLWDRWCAPPPSQCCPSNCYTPQPCANQCAPSHYPAASPCN